jgi:hypothetical protein
MTVLKCDRCKIETRIPLIKVFVSNLTNSTQFELCDSCAGNFEQSINNWLQNWAFDPKKK